MVAQNRLWLSGRQPRALTSQNADDAVSVETAAQETIRCQKVLAEDGQEVRLYCHSPGREQKEHAMAERFASRFEAALSALNEGLQRPRTEKRPDQLWERIGHR